MAGKAWSSARILDESAPSRQHHGPGTEENAGRTFRFLRLGIIVTLLLFCYLSIINDINRHSPDKKFGLLKKTGQRARNNSSLWKRSREKRSGVGGERSSVSETPVSQEYTYGSSCTLMVDNAAIERFYQLQAYHNKRMIYFRLNFSSSINVTIDPQLFLPYRWVWVIFALDHSTETMLKYPSDFGILSLGLLNRHVYRVPAGSKDEFVVNLDTNRPCRLSLRLGAKSTMKRIRDALKDLLNHTSKLMRSKSLFCYKNVINRNSRSQFWWYTTHMLTIQKEYTYYKCCREKNGPCSWNVYQTYFMWLIHAWSIAIVCFSPLFMHNIPDHKRKRITFDRWRILETDSGEGCSGSIDIGHEPPDFGQEEWIFLGENPTSILPMVKKMLCLHKSNKFIRRIWRVVLLLLSMSVLLTKVVVYYFIAREGVIEALRLDVPVGELCLPYGYKECLRNTENFLGGPVVYIPLYTIIASTLLCIPESIPRMFLGTKEFQDDANAPVLTFLYVTDGLLETRGIIRKQTVMYGYKCLAGKIKERFFMILNLTFWRSFFRLWSGRFTVVNLSKTVYVRFGQRGAPWAFLLGVALIPSALLWLILTGLCILEFITVILYYGLPLIFLLKLAISGMMNLVLNAASLKVGQENRTGLSYLSLVISGIISVVVLAAILFVAVITIYNFAHTFVFLVNILSFTFAGLVVYPEYSATYSIAAIAILYYLFRSVSGFTEGYIRLVKKVVNVSDRLQKSGWRPYGYHHEEEEYRPCFVRNRRDISVLGVPRACFYYVVMRVKPIRVQLSIAFLKVLVTANIIYSTVMITQSFRQGCNINLSTRTMAVIFVGLIPEVFGVFSSKVRRIVDEELLEKKIEKCVKAYWQEHLKLTSYEAVP